MSLKSRAFVTFDLLLALSAVLTTATVVSPVLSRSSAERKESVCVRNLSQIARGVTMYLQDHQGRFPTNRSHPYPAPFLEEALTTGRDTVNPMVNYVDGLDPYVQGSVGDKNVVELWRCPGVTAYGLTGMKRVLGYGDNRVTYHMSHMMFERELSSVAAPELTMLFREAGAISQSMSVAVPESGSSARPRRIFLQDPDDWFSVVPGYTARAHGDFTHVMFADGHVGRYQTSKLRSSFVVNCLPQRPGAWGLRDDSTGQPVLWLTP